MSMRTFLLLVFAEKTALDYWVETIVNRGMYYTRDDLLGLCKFAGIGGEENCASQAESPPIPCLHHSAETGGSLETPVI